MKNNLQNLRKQAGMTLIELTVVLLILIGLAGLALPYVSGFMGKTHMSTTASTINDLTRIVQGYTAQKFGAMPNNLDSLISVAGGTATVPLPNGGAEAVTAANGVYGLLQNTSMLAPLPLTAPMLSSLNQAGITSLYDMNGATSDATFKAQTGLVTLAVGSNVAQLVGCDDGSANTCAMTGVADTGPTFFGSIPVDSGDPVQNQLLYAFGGSVGSAADIAAKTCQTAANGGACTGTWDTACTNYVVMGINGNNSLIPGSMSTAPVHFAGTGLQAPNLQYNMYNAVVAVPSGACQSNAGKPASFVGATMIMPFPAIVGPQGTQQFTAENYNN